MRPSVVLITGSPGVGKTAVAAQIALRMGYAHIEEDVIYSMLPSLTREESSCMAVNAVIITLCQYFLAHGRSVVIEGIFHFQAPTKALLATLNIRTGCHLVATLDTCLARNQQRGPGGVQLDPVEVKELHSLATWSRLVRINAEGRLDEVVNAVLREMKTNEW